MKFSSLNFCSLVVSRRQFLGEPLEESVVEEVLHHYHHHHHCHHPHHHLHLAPVGSRLPLLQPPVVEEQVVEDREGVAGEEHFVGLHQHYHHHYHHYHHHHHHCL